MISRCVQSFKRTTEVTLCKPRCVEEGLRNEFHLGIWLSQPEVGSIYSPPEMNCRVREGQGAGRKGFPPITLAMLKKKIDKMLVVESLGSRHSKKQLVGADVGATLNNLTSQNVKKPVYILLYTVTLLQKFFLQTYLHVCKRCY